MKTPIRFLVLLLALAFLPGFARVSPAAYAVTDKAMVQQAISDTKKELALWKARKTNLYMAEGGSSTASGLLRYGKPGEDPTRAILNADEPPKHFWTDKEGGTQSGNLSLSTFTSDIEECDWHIARLEADLETQERELAKIEEEERKEIEEAWKRQWEIEKRLDREEEWAWNWNRDLDLASKGKPGYTVEAVDRHYTTGAGSRINYINGTQQPFSPKSTLHTEPTAAPPPENGGGSAPSGGGSLDKFLDQQTQASNNRGNDSQTLNQYTTQEKEQESKNTIARQDAENTVNQGGQNSQTIGERSASTTATSQDQNSWKTTLSGALEESLTGGLVSMGTTFAENTADNIVNKLFPPEPEPDAGPGGGGGGGGGGQNGGQPGGKKGGGKKGGGGGKKGGGGGGGGGSGHGEGDPHGGEGEGEGGGGGEGGGSRGGGSDAHHCARCGVSFDKIPQAPLYFKEGLVCEACAWESAGEGEEIEDEELRQSAAELGYFCERCGKVCWRTTAEDGRQVCDTCRGAILREQAGMTPKTAPGASSSGGGDDPGPINGTYSSSGGPAKTSEQGAYTCSRCGKKTDHVISGSGSGVYCSNECYQHRNDP